MIQEALRVLITVDAIGGVWQYGLDLARGLAARDAEVILAHCGPAPDAAQRDEAAGIPNTRLVETGLPLDWLCDDPAAIRAAGAAIAELAHDLTVDVAQLNMPTLAASARLRVPCVAVTHGCVATWWEAAKPGEALAPEYDGHRALMADGLRAANVLVAPSTSYARTVARHYDLPEAPYVVFNGRTASSLPFEGRPARRVLTAGRLWDRVKRSDILDRVAAGLDVPFEAAGAAVGPHGETVALENLDLLGQLDTAALADRLRAQPVFVSAASFEPFGLAVLEAAQAGCALVLSDIDTFRELWDGAAIFVPAENEQAYIRAARYLLDHPEVRAQMGAAARARSARYAPQAMADAMLALYGDALAGIPARRRAVA